MYLSQTGKNIWGCPRTSLHSTEFHITELLSREKYYFGYTKSSLLYAAEIYFPVPQGNTCV